MAGAREVTVMAPSSKSRIKGATLEMSGDWEYKDLIMVSNEAEMEVAQVACIGSRINDD